MKAASGKAEEINDSQEAKANIPANASNWELLSFHQKSELGMMSCQSWPCCSRRIGKPVLSRLAVVSNTGWLQDRQNDMRDCEVM